jgi:hypothetical protein
MKTRAAAWCLVSTMFSAIFAAGCGIEVLIPGEGGGGAGQGEGEGGGMPATTSTTDTTTGSSLPPPLGEGCSVECSVPPNGVDTCACSFSCGNSFPGATRAECAPSVDLQGNLKVKCVCTVNEEFTGVCFETNPAHLCDFDMGCCGKYLGK